MPLWIEKEHVESAIAGKGLKQLKDGAVSFCLSKTAGYCVLIRPHSAWLTDEGWRDANEPPPTEKEGRLVINFFKLQKGEASGYWFKIFLPASEKKTTVETIDDNSFCIQSNGKKFPVAFASLDHLMWDVMTGHAETESEIEKKFRSLCASKT